MILLRRFDFLPFPLPFTNRLLPGIPKQGTSHLHAVLRVAWVNSSFELRVPQKLSGSHRLDQSAKKKKAKIGRRPDGIPWINFTMERAAGGDFRRRSHGSYSPTRLLE